MIDKITKIMKRADLLSASETDVTISCGSLDDRDELFDILESLAMKPDIKDRIAEANHWFDSASEAMKQEDAEAQRQSFAYGNAKMHNPNITREMIAQEAEKLKCETCGETLSYKYASCKCGPRGVNGP